MNNEVTLPIGREQLLSAWATLQRCREGKRNLERRLIENEQWFRLRHWECMRKSDKQHQIEPASGWLFNCIANKHAEAMDAFPSPNFLPREAADREEAKMLSAIVPVVLEQNDFEEVYSQVMDAKLKSGTGVYGVFWDPEALGGLGDITIRRVDVMNLFWDSGISDIRQARNVFHVELVDNEVLEEKYPHLLGKLGRDNVGLGRYLYDDTVDTSHKSAVVDWYYKRHGALHYCKFVGEELLFATENTPEFGTRGLYDHGEYPFVFDVCFRMEGSPCGFSYIDVGKSAQEFIDRGNQAILMNMLANARPRHFIRADGAVNEQEYADLTRDFIHVDGNLGRDSILPVQGKSLSAIYVQVVQDKIDELKETTGNRDVSTGGSTGGVTAASAITAMQEAGSKLSRDHNRASYRAFRKVCGLVVELMRQFYTAPRCFRILGEGGKHTFVSYCNAGLLMQSMGPGLLRKPVFDIEISAQRQSPYARLSQNELAMEFYSAGFFDPARSREALACLAMMDFDRKEFVMDSIAAGAAAMALPPMTGREVTLPRENPVTKNAREQVATAALPE